MMRYGFVNNFAQSLAVELATVDTSMTLNGGGAELADASPDYRYKLTLVQTDLSGKETAREIVDVIGAAGDVLTVERRKEGTSSLSPWPVTTKVYSRVTGEQMSGFASELILFGPIDFSDPLSSASWQAPAGQKLYLDSIDVISSASGDASGWSIEVGTPTLPSNGGGVTYSPDDSLLAAPHGGSPYLTIINTADWSVVSGVPALPGFGAEASFSPDGTMLAVVHSGSPYLTVFNTADWSVVSGTPVLGSYGNAVKFSPDGTMLACGHYNDSNLTVLNTSDWSRITTPALPNECLALNWSHDSTRLATAHWNLPVITIFDTSDWSVVTGTPEVTTLAQDVTYNADSTMLAVAHGQDGLSVFNTSDWSAVTIPATPVGGGNGALSLAWDSTNGILAVGHRVGDHISIIDTSTWEEVAGFSLPDECWNLAYNNADSQLAAGHQSAPNLTIAEQGPIPPPTLDLGESVSSPDTILAGAALAVFAQGKRITVAANHELGVSELYASPGSATDAGAEAFLAVRGYLVES